ncbi:endo-1,3;1,4-beta-D-glucanase-like [Quercus lobata]|uniref:endo-1,3;1,4-beta-D-glucanase-like n=1 Tax=Quercus lobata TaxID=97700 RepID=UPI0012451135|nr:endo-1,3;1,4-beta-D-glucanase-like [Quercus lobata]
MFHDSILTCLSFPEGYEAPNLRKLADKVAAAGFFAVVPDFFNGDPYVPDDANRPIQVWLKDHGMVGYEAPILRKLADKVAASGFYVVVPDFFHGEPFVLDNANRPIQVWLKDHGPDKGFEEAKPVIEALRSKGVSAVGAAGFCWGAKVVVELAKTELIQAAVLLHPSLVTLDDIKGVKVPIAVLGAEIDRNSPPTLLKQFEEVLAAKSEVDGFVKIFPKVEHGWTIRYSVEDAAAVKSAEEAHQNLLEWFAKYVK